MQKAKAPQSVQVREENSRALEDFWSLQQRGVSLVNTASWFLEMGCLCYREHIYKPKHSK